MEWLTTLEIIQLFKEKGISLFTLSDFGRLLGTDNQNTVYKKIQRLEKKGIIKKLIKGKYLFLLSQASDFTIANFLYQPSYISLESALSFFGIITGFPYQITSITTKKTKKFAIEGKEFSYSQIGENLFWGYEKKEDFLIAEKEKALLDYFYFSLKGLKIVDFSELDLSSLNKERLKDYLLRFNKRPMLGFLKKLKI